MKRRTLMMSAVALAAGSTLGGAGQHTAKVYRIGLLAPEALPHLTGPFIEGMRERGWLEGRDYVVDSRVTGGEQARAIELARNLIESGVALIVTISTGHAVAAKRVSDTVPIVMLASGYPVEMGLAASLSRPGGNVTGLTIYAGGEIWSKYVELLRELRPSLRQLGVLWDYSPPTWPEQVLEVSLGELLRAARSLDIRVHSWMVKSDGDFVAALSAAERAPLEALFITSGGGIHTRRASAARIADFAQRRNLPIATDLAGRTFHAAGCVLAYSPDLSAVSRRGAFYVDRILRGAHPSQLPIELPAKFELVLNVKRARAIGLDIPPRLLARADKLIE